MRLIILFSFLFSLQAIAASVQSVKNNKVLINLDGQIVSPGQLFFLFDSAGKKRAIVKIRQIKNDRAVAEVTRGTPDQGYILANEPIESKPAPVAAPRERVRKEKYQPVSSYNGTTWGALGSILMSNMTADFTPSGATTKSSSAMKGTSFGALGFYEHPILPEFQLRAVAGLEQFNVTGTTNGNFCEGSSTCNVNITYLSMYGGGKFNYYSTSNYRLWLGASYGFLWALSKSSSILNTADISSNQVYVLSAGGDYILKDRKTFIPVSLDYGLFPSSATVKANVIYIRAGWGTNF